VGILEAEAAKIGHYPKTGKPIILILMTGRPLELNWPAEHIPAILNIWYSGTEAGNAVANLLFGDVAPSGRLPVTWPRSAGQEPLYYAHNLTHAPKDQDNRYWDMPSSPLFPFGYGLAYTSFEYSNLQAEGSSVTELFPVHGSIDVENTGDREGVAVVQFYIHQQSGSASRPVRELKAFQRVSLKPHEKRTVQFQISGDDLSYWSSASRSWVIEPLKFDIWAGGDSNASLHSEFRLR
jgi:beta-glucosidase